LNLTSWYQLAVIASIISGGVLYLGNKIDGLRTQITMSRLDLAMLFQHFGLSQPSRALSKDFKDGGISLLSKER
jgi:hypothetical protein